MPTSLKLLLQQEIYQYLPQYIKEDVENQRCPTDVAWELMGLWLETERLWGRKRAQDWVRRAYKRGRKTTSTEEMIEQVKKYLEARRFENIKEEWYRFRRDNKIESGTIYILNNYDQPGIVKVGMVHMRIVEDRVPEIQSQTGHSWQIVYKRYTISVFEAESRSHTELPNRIHPRQEFFKVSHKRAISIVDRSIDRLEEEITSWFDWYIHRKMYGNKRGK